MTSDQLMLFGLLLFVFVFLIWGRWRYDLVAFVALLIALLTGLVPVDQAFSGFGHPATVIIALVLIVSRGLSNSGAIEIVARLLVDSSRKLSTHITIMAGLSASLSAVMNNVAALALLMPVDMQAAKKAGRSPSLSLMPLSFASILGGMITLIGTPPNIIIAEFRGDALGEPYRMFDFAPVGIACAAVGVAYVALIGWRLLPHDRRSADAGGELFELADYIVEVRVPEGSPAVGKTVRDLDEKAAKSDVEIIGLTRKGRRLPGLARVAEIRAGDILVLEASPDSLEEALGALRLEYVGKGEGKLGDDELILNEAVVQESSRLAGRSAMSVRLLYRYRVALVGVSRQGKRFKDNVRKLELLPGDVLLLLGGDDRLADVTTRLGLLPLADRGQRVIQRDKAWLAVSIFGAAILAASVGLVYLPIALGCAVAAFIFFNIVPIRDVYTTVEWPVIVLLGAMIPIGGALQSTGGTGTDCGRHRRPRLRVFAGCRTCPAYRCDDDLVGRDEQHGDGSDCGAYCYRDRGQTRRQSGPVSDGGCGCGVVRVSDTYRTQEQHPDHGAGWVSFWRLLAHGAATRDPHHYRGCPGYYFRVADVKKIASSRLTNYVKRLSRKA